MITGKNNPEVARDPEWVMKTDSGTYNCCSRGESATLHPVHDPNMKENAWPFLVLFYVRLCEGIQLQGRTGQVCESSSEATPQYT
jgi:hypothetical protein